MFCRLYCENDCLITTTPNQKIIQYKENHLFVYGLSCEILCISEEFHVEKPEILLCSNTGVLLFHDDKKISYFHLSSDNILTLVVRNRRLSKKPDYNFMILTNDNMLYYIHCNDLYRLDLSTNVIVDIHKNVGNRMMDLTMSYVCDNNDVDHGNSDDVDHGNSDHNNDHYNNKILIYKHVYSQPDINIYEITQTECCMYTFTFSKEFEQTDVCENFFSDRNFLYFQIHPNKLLRYTFDLVHKTFEYVDEHIVNQNYTYQFPLFTEITCQNEFLQNGNIVFTFPDNVEHCEITQEQSLIIFCKNHEVYIKKNG